MAYHQGLLRQKGFGDLDYHRGLLRQKGFGGLGTLLKIGGPLISGAVAPLIGDLIGGLIQKQRGRGGLGAFLKIGGPLISGAVAPLLQDLVGGLIRKQRGRGIFTDVLKGGYDVVKQSVLDSYHGKRDFMDSMRRGTSQKIKEYALPQIQHQLLTNVGAFNSPIVGNLLRSKVLPIVRDKVSQAIDANINKYMQVGKGRKRRRRIQRGRGRKRQRGKGVVTDIFKMGAKQLPQFLKQGGRMLLRSGIKKGIRKGAQELVKEGTKQAIQSAAQAGIDALKGKSLKEAVVNRGMEGLQKTGETMETKLLSSPILAKNGPQKRKRKIKLGTGKKARTIDIFD